MGKIDIPPGAGCITEKNLYYNPETKNLLVRCSKSHQMTPDSNFFFKAVPVIDVTHLKAFGDYVEIYYKDGSPRDVIQSTMKKIAIGFNFFELSFIRVHRSFIVNHTFIERDTVKGIFLHLKKNYLVEESEKIVIPIGREYGTGAKLRTFLFTDITVP